MTASRLIFVRHAEKPDAGAGIPGIDERGAQSAGGLSVRGWQRAGALLGLFAPAFDRLPAIAAPRALYAAKSRPTSARPALTLAPLAERLGLAVDTSHDETDVDGLIASMQCAESPALACWRHESLPAIAAALAGEAAAPRDWPKHRFDLVWIFDRTADGWRLHQRPQQLLAGDAEALLE